MHPFSAHKRAAATSEPRAPRKLVGGRSAHERGLGGMAMLSSPPASLHVGAETGVPALLERVAR
eukprot:3494698-Prymnesium_polylepis.1